jgi:hypothetical protein
MKAIYRKMAVVFVAVLGLCAVASASAPAAQWYVGGKALSGSEKLSEAVKVEESIAFAIRIGGEPPSNYPTITCTGAKELGAEIVAPAALKIEALALEGCKLKVASEPSCKLSSTKIDTFPLEAKMSAGKSPEDAAEVVGTREKIWFNEQLGGCFILGETEWSIKGTSVLKAPKTQTEATEQEFVGPGEAGKGLTWYEQPVYLSGKLKFKLASGKAWSFH